MHCKNPYAIQRLKGSTLKTIPSQKYEFFVPCGKCLYCRLQRRKEWCLRLTHENQHYKKSSFVTLTYDDENINITTSSKLPTLKKSDLQKYFKKLRKSGSKFKYYACGEYGENTQRPHYHAILFGIDYDEEKLINTNWNHGSVHIGFVSPDSIRYTAQYIDKKIYGKQSEEHYQGREPEFQCQSQGMGLKYLEENLKEIIENGYILFKGKEQSIPRYYLKKMEEKLLNRKQWEKFSQKRKRKAKFKNLDINLAILKTNTEEYHNLTLEDKEIVRISLIEQGKQVEQTLKDKAKIYNQERRKL